MSKIVYVKWIDSGYSLRGDLWQTIDEVKQLKNELKEVETVGILIEDDSDWLIVATSLNLDMIRGGYLIFKKNILKMKFYDIIK